MVLRARIELAHLGLLSDRAADPSRLVELVHEAIPVFEELGDDRGLGRAWRHLGYVSGAMEGRCAEWLEASERALPYYRRTGWSPSGCLSEIAAAHFYGPTPVGMGIQRCEQLLAEVGDRVGRAHVLVYFGGLLALEDRLEEAFLLLNEAEVIYRELGELYDLADNCDRVRGRVHVLADDLEAAEQAFRRCCETFEDARDAAASSTVAAELGQVLYRQERYSEATLWARFAETHAPAGDIAAQFSWRALHGKLLAHEGLNRDADAVTVEAIRIVDRTDALTHRGEVRLDVAHVLSSADRDDEAASLIRQALQLFELKGNVVSARAARSALAELVHA
jgi:tetratricopeptide (TPR) repeat protein